MHNNKAMKGLKYVLCAFILLNVLKEIRGLQCYECFWSDTDADYDEEYEESEEMQELKYPKVKYYFDKDIKGTPTKEEVAANCKKKTCDPGQWCMKYTLKSSDPKKITRMCIGNPKQRSGCYQQVVELKESKDVFLTKEVCLCDEESLCNAAAIPSTSSFVLTALTLMILRYF